MKFKFITFVAIFFLVSNCGFQLSTIETNYNISSINTSGDQRINYKLKNEILKSSSGNNINIIEMEISSIKNKEVKEKNIKNEITKYSLSIKADISYKLLSNGAIGKFTIVESGVYNVSSKYSDTLNNEKNLTQTLIINLTEEILENLSIRIK